MIPEEQELSRLQAEQAQIEEQVASVELALETIKTETAQFRHRYYQAVGRLYAELDELDARIARAKAQHFPDDKDTMAQAHAAEQRAKQSAQEAGLIEAQPKPPQSISPELKQAYRQAVKLMHPDLATTEHERQRRTELMAQINLAYERGDQKAIEKLIKEYGQDPEAIVGEDVASRIVKTIRRIAQLRRRLEELQQEMDVQQSAEIFQLRQTIEKAEASGENPLGDLAHQLKQEISEHKMRLQPVRPPQAARNAAKPASKTKYVSPWVSKPEPPPPTQRKNETAQAQVQAQSFKKMGYKALSIVAGIALFAVILLLPVFFIYGTLTIAVKVLPMLELAGVILFALCLNVFLPLSFFRFTRSIAAIGLFGSSYVFGLIIFLEGMITTYNYWGGFGLIIGLMFMGIGVVPLAMLAAALHGAWADVGGFALVIAAIFGARIFAFYLFDKMERNTMPKKHRLAWAGKAYVIFVWALIFFGFASTVYFNGWEFFNINAETEHFSIFGNAIITMLLMLPGVGIFKLGEYLERKKLAGFGKEIRHET